MRLYAIDCDDPYKVANIDACYEYCLPWIRCEKCKNVWGAPYCAYPGLEIAAKGRENLFTDERVLTREEFTVLEDEIIRSVGRRVMLIPGAGLGPLTGTAVTHRSEDFAWSGFHNPLISKYALERLRSAGIEIETAAPEIRWRGKRLESHLDLHIEPADDFLYSAETAKAFTIRYCESCGYVWRENQRLKLDLSKISLSESKVPRERAIFRLREFETIVVTQTFVDAVTKCGLRGIRFIEFAKS